MNTRPESPDGPEDVDEAFAKIVADLEQEGLGNRWLEDHELDNQTDGLDEDERRLAAADTAELPRPKPTPTDDDDHYVPPEPPPLPRLRPATLGALAMFVIGGLLLIAPGLVGLASKTAAPLALIALTGGIAWLVLTMRQGPPPDSGWDDGAQV